MAPARCVLLPHLCLQGRTGFPLVDAVVRCLLRGGWVNFRMRAMAFSFAHYHLWLHWCGILAGGWEGGGEAAGSSHLRGACQVLLHTPRILCAALAHT